MADFCKQCSTDIFGDDYGDLEGISKLTDTEAKKYAVVICEGCGVTHVDHTGACVDPGCIKKHGNAHP